MFIAQSFIKVECYVAQKLGIPGIPKYFFMESMIVRIIITEQDFVSGFQKYIIHRMLKNLAKRGTTGPISMVLYYSM